ncbi:hypothetical protein MSG28_003819 [Choristoneura fumiferana]|uniref:Uncharacterized protein n=1 Tax=Choristoneura fumiferana TaxID=7141 RepID=A0ACC0KGH7_CHOFU|nr:hypothetical protein MSG28_003819 [Choristoneura fumiferana]
MPRRGPSKGLNSIIARVLWPTSNFIQGLDTPQFRYVRPARAHPTIGCTAVGCRLARILDASRVICVDGKQFRFDYQYSQEAEGWFKLHQVPATWNDAWLKCFREGAVLASPEDASMLAAMKTLTAKLVRSCGVYTGIHATFSKGDYSTIEGTPLSKIPVSWAPNEPDNFENGEDCLVLLPNGTLADVACSEVYPFFCYKKKAKHMFLVGCGTVDNGYTLDTRTGSCYKFHRLPQSWPRAFAACAGEGGHLAIINSDVEAQVIKDLYAKNPDSLMPGAFTKLSSHIGFCDWGERGLWLTIHSQTLQEAGYDKWTSGEPANITDTKHKNGQYCGAVRRPGTLNDVWCDLPTPFICEKAPDSLINDEDL